MSAAYAADAMDAYVSKGEEASYRSAVADYDVFLCIYYTLYGEDDGALADYMTCFEVYRYSGGAVRRSAFRRGDVGNGGTA